MWRSDAHTNHGLFLESAADKGISVRSSLREVRRTSHRVRRRRGPCRATGNQRDWSGSSRPPLSPPQTTTSGEREQVRPERAAAGVTTRLEKKTPERLQCHSKHWPSPNQSQRPTHRNANLQVEDDDLSSFTAVAKSLTSQQVIVTV